MGVSPSTPASCWSGCIAIKLPPLLTHVLSIDACALVSAKSPRITTSYWLSTVEVTVVMSFMRNSFSPSFSRISPR